MVLNIVRNFNKKEFPNELICKEVDFINSLKLSDIFLEHALTIYKTLPEAINIKENAKHLYAFLPEKFEAKEAIKIGKLICNSAERSVSNYLSDLNSIGWLRQEKRNGSYFKMNLH